MIKKQKYFLIFLTIIALTISVSAEKDIVKSKWTNTPVRIDGKTDEWKDIQLKNYKKLQIDYGFKNDKTYLFITLKFNDFKYLSSLRTTGITLWLNSQKKKKKKFGINFIKTSIPSHNFIAMMEKKYGPMPENKKAEIKKRKYYNIFQNKIIKGKEEFPINVKSKKVPAFNVAPAKRTLILEFQIPLERVKDQIAGIGASPGDEIMIGFVWGGMTKEMRAEMMRRRSLSSTRASSGRPTSLTGERRKEGTRSAPPVRRQKKYSFWIPVKLSINN